MTQKISVLEKTHGEWVLWLEEMDEPVYRATQLCNWIWKRGVFEPAAMTDFSKALREKLSERVDARVPEIVREERSKSDGTKKFLIAMADGIKVETALLKQGDRLTACLSTQAGCAIGCPFCSTGSSGFERNLTAGEIAGQFIVMEKHIGREINNIVFMGMGEPLLNTEAVLKAIRILNDPKMRGLGIRHIALSTAGIVPGIRALAAEHLGIRLAVSLHASDDELRDELVPCNANYPLSELMQALRDYQETTGDRITIEYAMFHDKNDTLEHARKLVRLLHGLHVFVNLIPANESKEGFERSKPETILRFQSVLKSAGFESEIRVGRGGDIKASCGQLKAKEAEDGASEQSGERPKRERQTRPGKDGDDRAGRGKSERYSQTPPPRDGKPRRDFPAHKNKPGDARTGRDGGTKPSYGQSRAKETEEGARMQYGERPKYERQARPGKDGDDRTGRGKSERYSQTPPPRDGKPRRDFSPHRNKPGDARTGRDGETKPSYGQSRAKETEEGVRTQYGERPKYERQARPGRDGDDRAGRGKSERYSQTPPPRDGKPRRDFSPHGNKPGDARTGRDGGTKPSYGQSRAKETEEGARTQYGERPKYEKQARPGRDGDDRAGRGKSERYSQTPPPRDGKPRRDFPAHKNKPGDARKTKRTK